MLSCVAHGNGMIATVASRIRTYIIGTYGPRRTLAANDALVYSRLMTTSLWRVLARVRSGIVLGLRYNRANINAHGFLVRNLIYLLKYMCTS